MPFLVAWCGDAGGALRHPAARPGPAVWAQQPLAVVSEGGRVVWSLSALHGAVHRFCRWDLRRPGLPLVTGRRRRRGVVPTGWGARPHQWGAGSQGPGW